MSSTVEIESSNQKLVAPDGFGQLDSLQLRWGSIVAHGLGCIKRLEGSPSQVVIGKTHIGAC
eukprot:1954831-Amphidinium_carterae.2